MSWEAGESWEQAERLERAGSKLEQAERLERAGSQLEQAGRLERAGSELGGWRELGASWSKGSELGGRVASFNLLPPCPLSPCPKRWWGPQYILSCSLVAH